MGLRMSISYRVMRGNATKTSAAQPQRGNDDGNGKNKKSHRFNPRTYKGQGEGTYLS